MTDSWLDLMITPKNKRKPFRSPEAEAQHEYDVKAVAAMRKKIASGRSSSKKKKGSVKPSPVRPVPVSRCAGKGEKIQTRTGTGQIYTYESAGHKCPDLF